MTNVKEEKLNQLFEELTQLLEDNDKPLKLAKEVKKEDVSETKSKVLEKKPKEAEKKVKLKEVKEYKDAKGQISEKNGWKAFKVRLASVALAGSVLLTTYTLYSQVERILNDSNSSKEIVSIYDIDKEKRSLVKLEAEEIKKQILLKSGYYFDNISDEEFADGYCRIFQYQKNINPNTFRSAMHGIPENKDQRMLEDMIEKAFGDEYANFSENKKRDYKQLAFELLPYSQPEETTYIRNPIIVDGLMVRNYVLKEKGYKIKLRINGDEKETIRNLGKIMHECHEMEESNFREAENNQEQFFDGILQKVLEEGQELSKEDKRDYEQLIYEWLPDNAKKYIKDPIEIEKSENEKINGMEKGE